jgi:hypothetical protein
MIDALGILVVALGLNSGAMDHPSAAGSPAAADSLPTIEKVTAGMLQSSGLFTVYWDETEGHVYLEFDEASAPVLYRPILAGGLGSNDVGLDRGLFDQGRIVRFQRIGRKVLLFEDNLSFRAETDNPDERAAVEDAFAKSVLFGFEVKAKTNKRILIDATAFVTRDGLGLARQLKGTGQGSFSLDKGRSALNPDVLKSFPDNVELEAWLTFAGERPGAHVRSVTPDPHFVTLRIRHSFVRLPDSGYEPRRFDPRSGFNTVTFVDYSTPISAAKERRFVARHRLTLSEGRVEKPIVYYLDRGTPEPIRSALLDGARWWEDAFVAAGLQAAFKVEVLPEGADPMDVRYNIIQWVHRSTRGWSWGGSLVDPRTGEILKGHVALGSLRVRQDYLLALGLAGDVDQPEDDNPLVEMALARIRQLSAHEVGHTLGLRHNFAASVSGRASVMDYPAPMVSLDESGRVDLSDAYAVGIGEWDRFAIRYGYTVFEDEEAEQEGLARILEEARSAGLQYITDYDARPFGGAHPQAHLWDNGRDPIGMLETDMEVRRRALSQFGLDVLKVGQPTALLEEVLVPLYLRHRYQIEAVSKLLAGVSYEYSVVGSSFEGPTSVDPNTQRSALEALLSVLDAENLEFPLSVRSLIPPRPPGHEFNRELFPGKTGVTFDPFTPAVGITDFVFSLLLNQDRMSRLSGQHIESPAQPGLDEVLSRTTDFVRSRKEDDTAHRMEVRRLVEAAWVKALLRAASKADAPPVQSSLHAELIRLQDQYGREPADEAPADRNLRMWLVHLIDRYVDGDLDDIEQGLDPVEMPPGSPIGG